MVRGILHHEGDALALDGLVLLVDHPVFLGGAQRRLRVHAREGVERVVHHLRDLPAEVLDLAVLVRRPLHGRELRGDVADFLALVADSLEVGDGLDDGDDDPQVARRRRPQRQDPAAFLVDGNLHAVDLVVVGGHRFAKLAVPSTRAVIALWSCCSTKPPICSTWLRTFSRSSLKRREM